MRTFHKVVTPLFALFALAGCGGSVSGVGEQDAGHGPGDDTRDPPPDGGAMNSNCPAKSHVFDGNACNLSGLVCPSSLTSLDCQGNAKSLACFCDGESWTCEQAAPTNCPAQTCPSPQSIYPGAYCLSSGLGSSCTSSNVPYAGCGGLLEGSGTVTASCSCTSSGWSCPISVPPCPPPQSCPDPYSVYPYQTCYAGGMVCPGNPQNCDGDTYYDALQCEGYWVPVATTTCAIGGYEDGGPGIFDAGVSYDAGAPQF
jgi:hypothetical protein